MKIFVCAALITLAALPARAQQADHAVVDLTLGINDGTTHSGRFYDGREAFDAQLTVGARRHRSDANGFVYGFALGARAGLQDFGVRAGGDKQCVSNPSSPSGDCNAPYYPSLGRVAVLSGWEAGTSFAAARLLAGPAAFAGPKGSAGGGTVQLDISLGWSHAAIVAAVRRDHAYRLAGENLRMTSRAFGLRLQ